MLLALVGVAVAGFALPGPARLGVLVLAGVGVRLAWRSVTFRILWWRGQTPTMPLGPERSVLVPGLAAVEVWLLLAWGLGLLEPAVLVGLVLLAAVLAGLWWACGHLVEEAEAEAAEPPPVAMPPPPPEPTPDERLDALLEDAPIEGIEFAAIWPAMAPHMGRSTVAIRLKERGWSLGNGRWRAKPGGVR